MNEVPPALTELRVASSVRNYERARTVLLVLILVVVLGVAGYLVPLASSNRRALDKTTQSLVILQCAVAPQVSVDAHGKKRSDADERRVFNACVANHGVVPAGVDATTTTTSTLPLPAVT